MKTERESAAAMAAGLAQAMAAAWVLLWAPGWGQELESATGKETERGWESARVKEWAQETAPGSVQSKEQEKEWMLAGVSAAELVGSLVMGWGWATAVETAEL